VPVVDKPAAALGTDVLDGVNVTTETVSNK
jgi:hypothetical protein